VPTVIEPTDSRPTTIKQAKRSLIIDLIKLNKIQSMIIEKSVSYNEPSQNSSREAAKLARTGLELTIDDKKHQNSYRENNPSRLSTRSADVHVRFETSNRVSRSNSADLMNFKNQFDHSEHEVIRYRLIKLSNSILVKSKEAYVYDLIREKVIGYNSIKQMKIDGHKKMKEISNE